jgi:hypothetical protein
MSRSISASMLVVFVTCASQRAAAQSPFVYSHYVPRPTVDMPAGAVYADISGSEHTLTVPAGTAFITWWVHHDAFPCTGSPCTARLRPIIGNSSPSEGLPEDSVGTSSGSWTTHTVAGSTTVKLQVAALCSSDEYQCQLLMDSSVSYSLDAMSWTLMVFPDSSAGVPAIGGTGLVLLTVVLLGIGGFLILGRRNPAPT